MTKLIPLDAAIAAAKSLFRLHTTGLYGAAGVQQYGLLTETAEATIRAVPAIDPAAIREAALRDARQRVNDLLSERQADFLGARNSFNRGSVDALQQACAALRAMVGEKK